MKYNNIALLSEITIFMKYAKYIKSKYRRETWEELCIRNMNMHLDKYPELTTEILNLYHNYVIPKKVLPSMRSLQFSGKPIEMCPSRIFNCFSRSTKFITSEGTKSFFDFKENDEVLVPSHKGIMRKAVVKKYGKQPINVVTFKRGRSSKTVEVTPNHRWILKNNQSTTDLKVGDVLINTPDLFGDVEFDTLEPMEKLYWCYGYIYGDGTIVGENYSMVRLCGKDSSRFKYRFEEMGFKTSSPLSCNGDFFAYTGTYLKTCPDLSKDSNSLVKAFVRGYLDADGQKNPERLRSTNSSYFCSIQSSQKDHIEFIENCFESVGVYISRKEDLSGKITNFSTRPETYRFGISSKIGKLTGGNSNWSVVDITSKEEEEEVWCLEVEEDHSFILSGGIVTGNCAYLPVDDLHAFSETMFLLLGGTGVGFSVQKKHIKKLPRIIKPVGQYRYLIQDSIIGWSDAVKVLMKSYFEGGIAPLFDYSDIRPRGTELKTSGGKAPGPEGLKLCLENIRIVLNSKRNGSRLSPLEVHDIQCFIAESVLSGGIRRSAMISFFDINDESMLTCKAEEWWNSTPHRAMANNSAVVVRHKVKREDFENLWQRVKDSGCGEPGIVFTNNPDVLGNPCFEIALKPFQFCNLVEINASDISSQDELNSRVKAATLLSTMQAGYTDFHYLRPIWKETTEEDALLGVSMTGIASGGVLKLDLTEAAKIAVETNIDVSGRIGINPAQRITTVKPAGTTSLVVGSSSGVHAWHDPYFIRRIRINKEESIYKYLIENFPQVIVDCQYKPETTAILEVPVKAPEGSIFRDESALDLLERVKKLHNEWIKPAHIGGDNTHNVSTTISIKEDEWDSVRDWMWENKHCYNGISVLPFDGGNYVQAPFETITKEKYEELIKLIPSIDLTQVVETEDVTDLTGEVACSGNSCEIK